MHIFGLYNDIMYSEIALSLPKTYHAYIHPMDKQMYEIDKAASLLALLRKHATQNTIF